MNDVDLLSIVERSATIEERCGPEYQPVPDHSGRTTTLLTIFRKRAAASNGEWFRDRLSWDGLDEASAVRLVGPVRRCSGARLPAWTDLLKELVCHCSEYRIDELELRDDTEELFDPIINCWIKFACARLELSDNGFVSEAAVQDLAKLLKNRLEQLCAASFRELGREFVAGLRNVTVDEITEPPTDSECLAFVQSVLSNGGERVFRTHALLTRLLCTMILQWVEFVSEFACRLKSDQAVLRSVPWLDDADVRVANVDSTEADVHSRGRAVLLLTLDSGCRLVYKPRNIDVDAHWVKVIEFVSKDGEFALKAAGIVDRGDYGWVEFIKAEPCPPSQIPGYFRRAGALLALVYSLRGQDFHYENVIASGACPVLVDMEGLFHPEPKFMQSGASDYAVRQALEYTVVKTCLLPCGFESGKDIGGFSNGMTLAGHSMAQLLGDHSDVLIDGFSSMYRYLIANGAAFIGALGVGTDQSLSQRFLFRNTSVYQTLLRQISTRSGLSDSAIAIANLESLSRAFVVNPIASRFREILRAEQRSMINYDVPMFTTRSDSRSLFAEDGTEIPDALEASLADQLGESMQALSEADLKRQVLFIRSAVCLPALNRMLDSPFAPFGIGTGITPRSVSRGEPDRLRDRVIDYCENRLHMIVDSAEPLNVPAAMRWTFSFDSAAPCYTGLPSALTLFDGWPGVALFAAAAKRTYASTIGSHLLGLASELYDSRRTIEGFKRVRGISVASGLLGPAYALALAGRITRDSAMVALAVKIVECLSPDDLVRVQSVELYSGSAGAIKALLAIAAIAEDAAVLDVADTLVTGLTGKANLRSLVQPGQLWSDSGRPLWGVATGAAGVGCALAKFGSKAGRADLTDLAIQLIDADIKRFGGHELKNLLEQKQLGHSFCFGIPGLSAVVNAVEKLTGHEFDISDLDGNDYQGVLPSDQVCIGELGRAEPYFHKRQSTGAGQAVAANFLTRFESSGNEVCLPGTGHLVHPGLYQGVSGIGYQLLRCLDTETLPSFLLVD